MFAFLTFSELILLQSAHISQLIAFNHSTTVIGFFDWRWQMVFNKTSILSHYYFDSGAQQHSKMTFSLGNVAHYSAVLICSFFFVFPPANTVTQS